MLSQTLKHNLAEWTDVDVAGYYVALALGVAPDPGDDRDLWGGKKWVFWSANPLGEDLCRMLDMLTRSGVLQKDDGQRYRWNPDFEWAKYGEQV